MWWLHPNFCCLCSITTPQQNALSATFARISAGNAASNPVVSEHVVLPILHLLLDAVRPDESRPNSKRPLKAGSKSTAASAAAAATAGTADHAGMTAPSDEGRTVLDSSSTDRKKGRVLKQEGADDQPRGTAGSPVTFSEFLSGKAGLAEYLSRRTASNATMKDSSRVLALR